MDIRQPPAADRRRMLMRWLKGQGKSTRFLRYSVIAGSFAGISLIIQAWILSGLLADVIDGQLRQPPWAELTGLLGLYLFRGACQWVMLVSGQKASAEVRAGLRRQLYLKIAQLGPSWLANHHSGAIAVRLMEQVDALDGFFARFLPQQMIAAVLPLVIMAVVFPHDWIGGLIFLVTAPLLVLFLILTGMGAESAQKKQMTALIRMGGHFLDRLQGLSLLRRFNQTDAALKQVGKVAEDFRTHTMSVLRVAFLSTAVLEFFAAISVALTAVYVGFSLLGYLDWGPAGTMDFRSGLFLLMLAPDFYAPLRQLATHYHDRSAAMGAADDITELLAETSPGLAIEQLTAEETGKEVPVEDQQFFSTPPLITFKNVDFGYGDSMVLNQLNLQLQPGEIIAIGAPSGAGKTSLIRLLLGFSQPTSGEILVNDQALSSLGETSRSRLFGWLGQAPVLFHGSLASNLLLANPQADQSQLWQALEQAGAAEFVKKMPQQLDTPLGENNQGISGGQARRIALARVCLHNAPVLLLDEPTAGLDNKNRDLLLAQLKQYASQRSVILVSHDKAVLDWADRHIELSEIQKTPGSQEEQSVGGSE
ncbi:thiol reductant ABC exporter subunit CydD [Pelagibaculum spongiae]|nr:thiol reductant ABC exporter subunit CydD [Pelagibaculum spongiae]